MKRNLLSMGLLLTIALTACAQQKKATTKSTIATKNSSTTQNMESASKTSGHITSINMVRGGCFGKCPSYTIDLYKDGRAVYTSHMFTQYEGTFEKNIGADKVQSLFKEFENYRVDTCGTYTSMIPDLPPLHYTIQFEKKKLEIRNATFGPKYLEALSKKIDEMVNVDDSWKKTAEPVKK